MEPYDLIIEDLKEKTSKTVKHLRDQLASIRTGRASPALVDTMRVDYYGTPTPLNQLAHISVPEARQLLIKPFDVSPDVIKEIEDRFGPNLTADPIKGLTQTSRPNL